MQNRKAKSMLATFINLLEGRLEGSNKDDTITFTVTFLQHDVTGEDVERIEDAIARSIRKLRYTATLHSDYTGNDIAVRQ